MNDGKKGAMGSLGENIPGGGDNAEGTDGRPK